MIRASGLGKSYAGVTALDDVSFEARPGEVLGFLGPNGAGKTTTMRILTGYLEATRGSVEICGRPLDEDPRAARARIGYLPESVPLYPEMRVEEYLQHRAALKDVPRRERRARLDEALAQAGITTERRRVIGQLSKGYRQRVGLADALLARPPVLVLDEPTDGLDPNQRREVLGLIAWLGQERTVILSTHILPEVEQVCGRVVILDRGRVIAEGKPGELSRGERRLRLVARGPREALLGAVRAVDGVSAVEVTREPAGRDGERSEDARSDGERSDGELALTVECARDVREELARAVLAAGALRELAPAERGLDQVFARLTGRAK